MENKRHANALPLSLLQATKQFMFFKGLMKIQLKEYVLRYPGQWIPVSFSFLWMGVCLIVESRHALKLYYTGYPSRDDGCTRSLTEKGRNTNHTQWHQQGPSETKGKGLT